MAILKSIHPEYVDSIFDLTKRVEFMRKFKLSHVGNDIYIYSTSPVMKVVGYFHLNKMYCGSINHLESIWNEYHYMAGITYKALCIYYKNAKEFWILFINKLVKFETPFDPYTSIPGFKAPQSYKFVDNNWLDKFNLKEVKVGW